MVTGFIQIEAIGHEYPPSLNWYFFTDIDYITQETRHFSIFEIKPSDAINKAFLLKKTSEPLKVFDKRAILNQNTPPNYKSWIGGWLSLGNER